VHVFEEEDAAVEVELPRRRQRFAKQPEAAADERRGCAATADRADVRIVRPCGDLAQRLRIGKRSQEPLLRPVASLGAAHAGEARTVEADEPGPLANRDVQDGDVGVADQRLRVRGDDVEVEVRDDLRRAIATAQHLDHVDLGVGEQRVQVVGSAARIPGDVVVAGIDAVRELDVVPALRVPAHAAVDLGPLLERTGGGRHPNSAAFRKRARFHVFDPNPQPEAGG